MSVETAARAFYLLSQCLVVSGAVAIELVVKKRFDIAGFVALMFLYSLPFAWGFVNFEFALGVALWGTAGALHLHGRSWPVRLAAHTAFTVLLFFSHFFALGVYGATIGLYELWRARAERFSLVQTLGRLIPLGLPTALLLILMMASGGSIGGTGTIWHFAMKPLWILQILNGYSLLLSSLGVSALAVLLLQLRKRGALKLEGAGPLLAAGFAALYLLIPSKLFYTSYVDFRILVAAALILPAFLTVSPLGKPWRMTITFTAIAIILSNLALVSAVWASYDQDFRALREAFHRMEKGKMVLVGHSGEGDDPPLKNLQEYPIFHGPTLAVHYADAFVPTMFTARGKQPLTTRPQYDHLDIPYQGLAPILILKAIAEGAIPPGTPAFVHAWHRDYDYLFVVGTPAQNPMPALLEHVHAGPRFILYRIRK